MNELTKDQLEALTDLAEKKKWGRIVEGMKGNGPHPFFYAVSHTGQRITPQELEDLLARKLIAESNDFQIRTFVLTSEGRSSVEHLLIARELERS